VSVGNARKDNFVRDVQIDDQSQRDRFVPVSESYVWAAREVTMYTLQVLIQHLSLPKGPWETVEDPRLRC